MNPINEVNEKTTLKKNIITWYPFTPNSTILEIENNLEGISEEQYDYVVLKGTLEYAHQLFPGTNPEYQLLEYAKKHLKEDGRLILIINNKIGMKK